jgi:hypothetical protein
MSVSMLTHKAEYMTNETQTDADQETVIHVGGKSDSSISCIQLTLQQKR